jgi:cell wall assembly regulator SMI1
MTIQTLFDAWLVSGVHHSMKPPATEAEISAAEKKIGAPLPYSLRAVYPLFNGGWAFGLDFFRSRLRQNITR